MTFDRWFRLRDASDDRFRSLQYVRTHASQDSHKATLRYDEIVRRIRATGTNGWLVGDVADAVGEFLPVRVPWDAPAHTLVQGSTGTGKTREQNHIYREHVKAHRGITAIDAKRDMYEENLAWLIAYGESLPATERVALFRKTVVVDPFSTTALVPLNICRPIEGVAAETQAFEVTCALSQLFDNMSFHMQYLLTQLIVLLIEHQPLQLSLAEAPLIIRDETLRLMLTHRSNNEKTREFFFAGFNDIPEVTKQAVLTRLEWLLMGRSFGAMLGADDCLDLKAVIRWKQPMLVFVGKHASAPHELTVAFGSLFLQLFFQAAYSLGTRQHLQHVLEIDEFFHLVAAPNMTSRLATALSTVRSFGIQMLLAHHDFSQIPSELRGALLTNIDRIALFRSAGENADWFGDFVEMLPNEISDNIAPGLGNRRAYQREMLQSLPDRHFLWYDRRQPYRALRLRAPDVPDAHKMVGISLKRLEELRLERGWDTGAYAIPISQLQRQLRNRRNRLVEMLRPTIVVADRPPTQAEPKKQTRPPKLG